MKKMIQAGIIFAAGLLFFYGYQQYKSQAMAKEIAGKIIRFHVRANSDAEVDQTRLKGMTPVLFRGHFF